MTFTLKEAHKKRFIKQLVEIKSSPTLLQEYYDQKQLEAMLSTVQKLHSLVQKIEFFDALDTALMKAYADLDDYMSMSKIKRAVTLGSGMKKIEKLTTGIIEFFSNQLYPIMHVTFNKLYSVKIDADPTKPEHEKKSAQSFSDLLEHDPVNMKKLTDNIKKALKPGALGISDLPYIDVNSFIDEIMQLSLDDVKNITTEFKAKFQPPKAIQRKEFKRFPQTSPLKVPSSPPGTPGSANKQKNVDPAAMAAAIAAAKSDNAVRILLATAFKTALNDVLPTINTLDDAQKKELRDKLGTAYLDFINKP